MSDNSELKKPAFWIGQICVIIATVLGVFLASNQAFKQAMQFDQATSLQSNYYLRQSLRNELESNVGYIGEYVAKVEQRIVDPQLLLETFVWNNMTYASNSLETPSALLREAQEFYRRANEIMNTSYFNDNMKAQNLKELADRVTETTLPMFDANLAQVRDRLTAYKISVE